MRTSTWLIGLIIIVLSGLVGCSGGYNPAGVQEVSDDVGLVAKEIATAELIGDDVDKILQILQTGNAASAPFNPYALPIGAGLTLLSSIYAMMKRNESITSTAKYTAHKRVIAKEMLKMPSEKAAALYEAIGNERVKLGIP